MPMSTFNIAGDSSGCATGTSKVRVTYKFAIGSILFSCAKARKGIIEVVAIKDVRLLNSKSTYSQWVALYIDSFNGLWNEDELCTEIEARQAATDYLYQQQQDLLKKISQCYCKPTICNISDKNPII